ncbi:MAG: IS200/IS605 family transposase [Candidatus Sumerlaeia bacterium]|nr:IS200/IS605 family transposase [Candidatus Sumerlaeia bacterium]
MSQSLSRILIHAIFSTKNRIAHLTPAIRRDLYPYAATVLANMGCPPIQIGGMDDHIHIFCVLSKSLSVAQFIENIKKPTSRWLKTKDPALQEFHWQNGYGAFSVSQSRMPNVRQYIRNQEIHHKTVSFQDEFRKFLKEYGVAFDEQYVWD